MNTPDPVPNPSTPPTSIPWYQSAVLKGLLIAALTQLLVQLKHKYNIDLSVYGVDVNDIAVWLMNIVGAAAVAYAAHGRVSKPLPQVRLPFTKGDPK